MSDFYVIRLMSDFYVIIQTYIEGGIEAVSTEQNIIDTLATA